jgi:hypothetical protein
VSGTPLPATACGNSAGARFASEGNWVGDAGIRLVPGICPCGIGVPGTLGPKPAGLASGEPGGAMLDGRLHAASGRWPRRESMPAASPKNSAQQVRQRQPGSAANMALAMRASNGRIERRLARNRGGCAMLTAAYL